jgi:hypothetical protein
MPTEKPETGDELRGEEGQDLRAGGFKFRGISRVPGQAQRQLDAAVPPNREVADRSRYKRGKHVLTHGSKPWAVDSKTRGIWKDVSSAWQMNEAMVGLYQNMTDIEIYCL